MCIDKQTNIHTGILIFIECKPMRVSIAKSGPCKVCMRTLRHARRQTHTHTHIHIYIFILIENTNLMRVPIGIVGPSEGVYAHFETCVGEVSKFITGRRAISCRVCCAQGGKSMKKEEGRKEKRIKKLKKT